MGIEWQVHRVYRDVMVEKQSKAPVGATHNRLRTAPEQAVVNEQEICTSVRRAADGALGDVDCRGDSLHRTLMIELQAVQRRGVIGMAGHAEQPIDPLRDVEGTDHHGWGAAHDTGDRQDPAVISFQTLSRRCRAPMAMRSRKRSFITNFTVPVSAPNANT